MRNKVYIYTLSAAFLVGGCATYESKPVPIRPASSYTLQARPQYALLRHNHRRFQLRQLGNH